MKWRSLEARFDKWLEDNQDDPHEWHDWFAWYPKRIGTDVYWLVTLQRALARGGAYNADWWKYREKP